MNKNTKILISILVVFTILISYTAYSDISSSNNTSNIKPKMLSEKQISNLYHFHNYASFLYSNTSNFNLLENSYCGYSVLKVYHNNTYRGMFFDKLNIFKNIADLNQYLQGCKYVFNQSQIASERWNGNIDFTFYISDFMLNSSFINSTYNGCGDYVTWFFAVNGTKLIDFFIPYDMFQIYTVFTNLAEILFTNAKNITYSTLNQKSIFF